VFEQLKSIDETAKRLNVSDNTVIRYLSKAGVYKSTRKSNKRVDYPPDLFVRLRHEKRLTLKEIADKLDVSEKTVCKRLRQAGYRSGKVKAPKRELYLSLKNQGLSNEEIAQKCGVLTETVRQMLLNHAGGAKETRGMQSSAKRYIRLYKTGMTIREIAEKCGKAYVTVAKSLRLHGITGIEKNGVVINDTTVLIPSFSVDLGRLTVCE
jgi:transposase